MDRIEKFLKKVNRKEKEILRDTMKHIYAKEFNMLSIKKIEGYDRCYRVRKGEFRLIFYMKNDCVRIISVDRKDDNTYRKLK